MKYLRISQIYRKSKIKRFRRAVWIKLVDSNVFFIVVDNIIMILDLRKELMQDYITKTLNENSLKSFDTGGRYIKELATGYIRYSLCYDNQVSLKDE